MAQQNDNTTMDSNKKVFANSSRIDWNFKKHIYPLELEGSPELSHYIMFYIAVPERRNTDTQVNQTQSAEIRKRIQNYLDDKGKADFSKQLKLMTETTLPNAFEKLGGNELTQSDTADSIKDFIGKENIQTLKDTVNEFKPQKMVFTKEAVCLYIPETLSVSYDMDWEGTSMRSSRGLLKAANEAIGAVTEKGFTMSALGDITKAVAGAAVTSLDKVADTLGLGGIGDMMSVGSKMITNPYMEMLFKGVKNRSFELSFKFTPKSPKEAEAVYDIIQTFKKYALPEIPKAGASGIADTFYIYPGEFDIIFYTIINDGTKAVKNKFLARYGRSVLTSIKVDYGAVGATSFLRATDAGAPPAETDLSLSFTEIDLLSAEMIEAEQGL